MQASNFSGIAALAVGLALSSCATAPPSASSSSQDLLATGNAPARTAAGVPQRDLSPDEKKVIVDSVAPSLRNPASAKYKWAKFPTIVTEDSVNYCATVDAGSPYPAYNGQQAYIVEARVSGGHVSGAVMGLIAGGKDFAIVAKLCAKYGLDPKSAS